MGLYGFYKGTAPFPRPPRKLGKGNEAAAQASKYEYCSNHSRLWFIQYKRKTRLKTLDIIFETPVESLKASQYRLQR